MQLRGSVQERTGTEDSHGKDELCTNSKSGAVEPDEEEADQDERHRLLAKMRDRTPAWEDPENWVGE